jgi:hypothetical protein
MNRDFVWINETGRTLVSADITAALDQLDDEGWAGALIRDGEPGRLSVTALDGIELAAELRSWTEDGRKVLQ